MFNKIKESLIKANETSTEFREKTRVQIYTPEIRDREVAKVLAKYQPKIDKLLAQIDVIQAKMDAEEGAIVQNLITDAWNRDQKKFREPTKDTTRHADVPGWS